MKSIMIVILFLVFTFLIDKDNSPFFLQDTWFIIIFFNFIVIITKYLLKAIIRIGY